MYKNIGKGLLCVIFLAQLATVKAQQGSLMLYGSLNYRHTNHNGSSFGANPFGVGYFFNDHVVAGLNYGFDWEKDVTKITVNNHHEAGPFYSDSWHLGDHFVFIAQADAHYVWGDHMVASNNNSDYNGYLLRVYPIVSVVLGHGWALKAKFCELSYQSTKDRTGDEIRNNTFVAGVNGSTVGLGVSKNIALFKK